jgi:novobiocin biosynthesis protein NovU/D-mycarose 3-C-methyltransferase
VAGDIVRRVEACRVCGGTDWLDVVSLGSTALANAFVDPATSYEAEPAFPLEVGACRHCWLMSLRHVVDPEVLFGHYFYLSSESELMRRHEQHVVAWSTRLLGLSPGDLVVEIGSNTGTVLARFADRGQRVLGVDPARNLAQLAADRGVETVLDFFVPEVARRIARQRGRARLVLGRHCLAHIDDVHDALTGVEKLLAPDGALVIEVPYLVDLLEENQFDTIYHEHLSYFSVGTLNRLFKAHGLRVVDVERVAVHGGSILVCAAPARGPHRPRPAVAELLALEEERGLSTERPYQQLAMRTRHVTAALPRLVRDLVASGQRVAGYGAPAKGCTLLEVCGLGPEDLEFCTDTTPLKQGKVTPGSHIPVWAPAWVGTCPPDYYLLLAWTYAEEIFRNEREYLAGGGRFIVPIPEPRVVSADDVLTRSLA